MRSTVSLVVACVAIAALATTEGLIVVSHDQPIKPKVIVHTVHLPAPAPRTVTRTRTVTIPAPMPTVCSTAVAEAQQLLQKYVVMDTTESKLEDYVSLFQEQLAAGDSLAGAKTQARIFATKDKYGSEIVAANDSVTQLKSDQTDCLKEESK